jgi:NTP pyrophosphatase (non-canonical NTP hydrolase)
MRISKYFATGDSKMEDETFVGFASIDTKHGRSRKFRMAKIASTFTAEALEIIEKIDSEQNFTVFSDSATVLKSISNSCTVSNTSHITQMLEDKTERPESRGKQTQFYWVSGHCGVEVNERASNQRKQR